MGRPNSGKTSLLLSLAEYIGLKQVDIVFYYPDGKTVAHVYAMKIARQELVSPFPNQHLCSHRMVFDTARRSGGKRIELLDTPGLSVDIVKDERTRNAMVDTLRYMEGAAVILNVIDAPACSKPGVALDLETQLAALTGNSYVALANKMDLPGSRNGLERLKSALAGRILLPTSSVTHQGMGDLRSLLLRSV